jgi:preprotein translocase subunit YajC
MILLISTAYAQTGEQAQPTGSPFVMLLIFFAIFYFLVLRPQSRTRKEHGNLIAGLKKGDRLITDGGIVGTVHQVEDNLVVLELPDRTRLPLLKESVRGHFEPDSDKKE